MTDGWKYLKRTIFNICPQSQAQVYFQHEKWKRTHSIGIYLGTSVSYIFASLTDADPAY